MNEELMRVVIGYAILTLLSYAWYRLNEGELDNHTLLLGLVWVVCALPWAVYTVIGLSAWLSGTPWSQIVSYTERGIPVFWWWKRLAVFLFAGWPLSSLKTRLSAGR